MINHGCESEGLRCKKIIQQKQVVFLIQPAFAVENISLYLYKRVAVLNCETTLFLELLICSVYIPNTAYRVNDVKTECVEDFMFDIIYVNVSNICAAFFAVPNI